MLAFGNKEFRNLQEQVLENMRQIDDLKQAAVVLDEFGIKVIGQIESADELPDPETYEGEFGDAYAVGTEAPYELYIWTRGDSLGNNAYWFDIGAFPQAGPQGQQGAQGEQGPSGTISFGTITTTTLQPGQSASVTATNVGTASNAVYNMSFAIPQGAQGIPGETGATGATGATGPQGPKGDKGDTGTGYIIMGQLDSALDLPDPGATDRQAAYLIGANEPYDLYVIVGLPGHLEWFDAGLFTTAQVDINEFEAGYGLSLGQIDDKIAYAVDTNVIPVFQDLSDLAWNINASVAYTYATKASLSSFQSEVNSAFTSVYAAIDDLESATQQYVDGISQGDRRYAADVASAALSNANIYTDSSIANLSSVYATPAQVSSAIDALDYASVGALSSETIIPDITGYATEVYVQNELSGYAKQSELSNYTPLSEMSLYASVSAVESAISGVNATINSLNYLSVGALSSETVIPDITGLASETYVDNSISALSSIYASISALPDMSLYAELSGSNTFTGINNFSAYTAFTERVRYGSYISFGPGDARIFGDYIGGISYLKTNCNLNVSGTLSLTGNGGINMSTKGIIFYESTTAGYAPIRNIDLSNNSYDILLPKASGTLALKTDIPSISEYATISALSSAINGLSSIYAPISDYASQAWVSANFLSSGYVPTISGYAELSANNTFTGDNTFSLIYTGNIYPTAGSNYAIGAGLRPYLAIYANNVYAKSSITVASVSYASEVFTFTLSDNTTVSKIFLVG